MILSMGITGRISRRKTAGELTCDGCSDCCQYVAVELDRPRSKRDYSHLFWHLHHENVSVYIGHDRSWNIEFMTPCSSLTPQGLCGIYMNRPVICQEYSLDNCTHHTDGKYYRHRFMTAADLQAYLREKGIDFEFKKKD